MFENEVNAAIAHWQPAYGVRIPSNLVHGIIEKESVNGRYTTTSEPGGQTSRGPMMVLDSTALSLGAEDPAMLEQPATGIWYGVQYLGSLLGRFGGDIARATSAYNLGPGRAVPNAQGSYPNQQYVNDVFAFARRYAMAAVPVAVGLALLALLFLIPRRRAAVSR